MYFVDPLVDARYKAVWLRKHKGLIHGVQSMRYDCGFHNFLETPAVAVEADRRLLDALAEAGPLRSLKKLDGKIFGTPLALGFVPSTLEVVHLDAYDTKKRGTWSKDTPHSIAIGLAAVTGLQSLSL
jgi:hypothetical protein